MFNKIIFKVDTVKRFYTGEGFVDLFVVSGPNGRIGAHDFPTKEAAQAYADRLNTNPRPFMATRSVQLAVRAAKGGSNA